MIFLRKRKGSASALIILVLTVLVLLGVLSLVTVAADRRLAGKRADWLQEYYQIDTEAVRIQARLAGAIEEKLANTQASGISEDFAALTENVLIQFGAHEIQTSFDRGVLNVFYIVGDTAAEQTQQLLEINLAVSTAADGSLVIDKLKWQQRQSERPQTDETGVIWIPE